MKLWLNALLKYISGLLLTGAALFLPAGTLAYEGGWRFIMLLFIPMLLMGAALYIKKPELLEKRLNTREKQAAQKGVTAAAGIIFLSAFLIAGLDFRHSWTNVPGRLIWAASILMLLSYGLYAEVMRENAWLSRTIKVEEGQKVVDTGLYGIVRHPMYMATILLFLMIPLILGSWIALMVFCFYPKIIILRLKEEEFLLKRELPGYAEYMQKVKYRILPFIW